MSEFFSEDFIQIASGIEQDAEFIPLISAEEEENINKQEFPEELPILPLRNNVLFLKFHLCISRMIPHFPIQEIV